MMQAPLFAINVKALGWLELASPAAAAAAAATARYIDQRIAPYMPI
jgi:hypothetical protein